MDDEEKTPAVHMALWFTVLAIGAQIQIKSFLSYLQLLLDIAQGLLHSHILICTCLKFIKMRINQYHMFGEEGDPSRVVKCQAERKC